MKLVRLLSAFGVAAMTVALLNGFIVGDFFADGGLLLENPWGIVSLVDLYVGFVLFSIWVYVRESNKLLAIGWIVSIMVLGFFSGALYVLIHSLKTNSMTELLLGKHA